MGEKGGTPKTRRPSGFSHLFPGIVERRIRDNLRFCEKILRNCAWRFPCHPFWEHRGFTGDREFLARRAFPLLKELCEYREDHLVEDSGGKPISPTGWSPGHGRAE
jgi:hypothetical protein